MLVIDGTLLVQLVNFIVFLAILNVIFFKPVGAAIRKRREYIDGLGHDIEQFQREAKTYRGQAEERRARARREAAELMARLRVEITRESDAITLGAQGEAAEIIAKAQLAVAHEVDAARVDEYRVVDTLANEMLERAIGRAS